jgi:hypothetical protein
MPPARPLDAPGFVDFGVEGLGSAACEPFWVLGEVVEGYRSGGVGGVAAG